jgi:glutathione synthase/RimK-type ligase-like ATP-grasp enzyme
MRALILAYTLETHATRRLVETFARRGHDGTAVSPLDCVVEFSSGLSRVIHKGQMTDTMDAVRLRCLTYVDNGVPVPRSLVTSIAMHFLEKGAFCLNSPRAKLNAVNKRTTAQVLGRAGVPMPRTAPYGKPPSLRASSAVLAPPSFLSLSTAWEALV